LPSGTEENCRQTWHCIIGGGSMKAYNYSEERKRLSEVLDIAKNEEVLIKRRGEKFFL